MIWKVIAIRFFCYNLKQRKMQTFNTESPNFSKSSAFFSRNVKRTRTPELDRTALIKMPHKSCFQKTR